ncbi:hypothetical protein QWY74_08630 [Halomonas almeriensis]|uniref:hypothetical protein n=1 Tax=Halomonas almeriensis TaxID=308163 RepID=UPI0025B4F791|nr:hypothetical protein [Halomonas almeriensis]MDN3553528.1 hypothetical protein [Halomonas almeriensis]
MIWHLIAAVFAGLGAAGLGLLMRLLSGKRLPRWIVPIMAGMGMLGYQIQHEYGWYEHTRAQLPDSARIVSTSQDTALWRPWTYLLPMTTAFTLVDEDGLRHIRADGQTLAQFQLYRFSSGVGQSVVHQAHLLNCDNRELIPLGQQKQRPQTDERRRLGADDPLYRQVCPPHQ